MQDSSLEHDERRSEGVLNLYLNRIRQVLRDRRHSQQIRRANEEVAVERRHAQVYMPRQLGMSISYPEADSLFEARTRITASNMMGWAKTELNSWANLMASSVRALNAG